ncbi:MAG TPA: tetratricopeptide repeat protein [Woeseiaceae bacterium]|jgi:tetratricopeptide (TPR) repeat protein
MNRIGGLRGLVTVVALYLSITACAGTSSPKAAGNGGDQLHDADFDLLFATEFPVANKAEALSRAASAIKERDVDRALFFYIKALQFDPQDADLLALIGNIHRMQQRAEYAVRAYTLALRVDPDHLPSLEGRGLILLAHNEDTLAAKDLARTVAISPDAWRAYNGLGILADRREEHGLAVSYYDLALTNPAADSAVLLNNRGYSNLLSGRYNSAQSDLEMAAIKLGYTQAWVNLGTVYARQRQYQRAVEAYRQVLNEPEACNKAAAVAIEDGELDAAERLLERAIRLSPTYYPEAEESLAQLRQNARNF